MTYKGPKIDKISKTREEIEVKIEDGHKMEKILEKLGKIDEAVEAYNRALE